MKPLTLIFIFLLVSTSCQLQEQEASLVTGRNSQARTKNALAITGPNVMVNVLNQATYTISGNCSEQGSSIQMTLGPLSSSTNCNLGTFSFVSDLSGAMDGIFNFSFEETLSDGVKHYSSYSTTKDTTAPTVNDIPDDSVPVASKTITWSCNETCSFRYAVSTSAFVVPVGSYTNVTSATVNTGVNRYYIHVQAMDAAGNESAVETAFFFIDENL